MVSLDIACAAGNVGLVGGFGGIDTVPADGSNKDLAVALHLGSGEAASSTPSTRLLVRLLDRGAQIILIARAVGDGNHLDNGSIDGLARCVWLELDGVAEMLAAQNGLHLLHGLAVSFAGHERVLVLGGIPA